MLSDIFFKYSFPSVSPMSVYYDVFKLGHGYLQEKDELPGSFKTNPIIIGFDNGNARKSILFEDQFESIISEFQKIDFAFVSGLTYFGRTNSMANASKCFALIFDLDDVSDDKLNTLIHGMNEGIYPKANYIVESGHGIHLYYVFETPIDLYPETKRVLKDLKYALIDLLWNMYTSNNPNKQFQGINQGFRVIGGKTKESGTTVAYKLYNEPITLEYLNSFNKTVQIDLFKQYRESKMSLEDAKTKYPEWYERRVLGNAGKGTWIVKRDLYDWWIRKIKEGATFGHRYYCIMTLAIYAAKCHIPEEELRKDAYDLIPYLNAINPNEPFTEHDVDSALESYDERYKTFPRKDIEKITSISIPPNKRNGRKQSQHLEFSRGIRKLKSSMGEKVSGGGRPKMKKIIQNYRRSNPAVTKSQCHKETGISRPTINKWWDSI